MIEFVKYHIESLEEDNESDPYELKQEIRDCQELIEQIEKDNLSYLQGQTGIIEIDLISDFENMVWDHPADLRNFRIWLVKTRLAFAVSDRVYSTRKLTFKVDGKDYEW